MTGFARHWGQGAPALMLHCSLAHSGAWDGVARRLTDRLAMSAPDMLGHGKAGDGDRTADYHDQLTEQSLAFLGPDPTHVIGHSFGATVALRLVIEHPDRVASLVLIEPVLFAAAAGTEAFTAHQAEFSNFGPAYGSGDMDHAVDVFTAMWGDGRPYADLPGKQQAYLKRTIWTVAAGRFTLWEDAAGLLPRLDQVHCPILLLEGDQSPEVIAAIQARLLNDLPNARRAVIAGAGHMGPITHPQAFADQIGAFLDDVL